MVGKSINQRVKEKVSKDGAVMVEKRAKRFEDNQAKVREAAAQAEVDTEVITKRCTKCGEVKALDAYNASKNGKYGKNAQCKVCLHKYYQENKERIAERHRKYYRENKEQIINSTRKYREENKNRISKYREENKERIAEWHRKYHQKNKQRRNEYRRKYREENKEQISVWGRKYREENQVRISEYMRKYREENPESKRRSERKRRAVKRSLPHAPLTPAQYERLYEFRDQVFGEVTS